MAGTRGSKWVKITPWMRIKITVRNFWANWKS